MKKAILFICVLLFAAGAFTESVYDYIPKINGRFECSNGFCVDIGGNGISYTITNHNAETDILAVRGNPALLEFIVRTRGRNFNGQATLYKIAVKSDSTFEVTQCKTSPFKRTVWWYFTAELNDSSVNVRDTPDVTGNRLGQYQKGDKVTFAGAVDNQSAIDSAIDYWYNIEHEGGTAWIYGKYITFQNKIFLNSKMFQNLPAANLGGPAVSDMPIKAVYVGNADATTKEIFDVGTASVTFTNDGHGEFSETLFSWQNGDEKKEIVLPWRNYYQYAPETGMLIYLSEYDYFNNSINCFDCRTGTFINLTEETGSGQELLVSGITFAINETGTKLAFTGTSYKKDDYVAYPLYVVDLKTWSLQKYEFDLIINPANICWIDDSHLLVTEYNSRWDGYNYICCLVSLSGSDAHIQDTYSISLSGKKLGNPANPYSSIVLPTETPGVLMVYLGDEDKYHSNYYLTCRNGAISCNSNHPLDNTSSPANAFSNTFWYQDEMYVAAYDRELTYGKIAPTVIIYDSSMTELKKEYFEMRSYSDYVNWVGIRDGEIIIALQED